MSGAEARCPTCRQLNPIGFPFDGSADVTTLASHALNAFQREAAMCVVATMIFVAFLIGGGVITNLVTTLVSSILGLHVDPVNPLRNLRDSGINFAVQQAVGTAVNMAVMGITLTGFYRLLIDVLEGKRADIGRMFTQVHLLPQYVLLHVILFLFITLPTWIYMGVTVFLGIRMVGADWNHLERLRPQMLLSGEMVGLLLSSSVLYLAVAALVLPVSMFATMELIVGRCDALEAIKRAWDLGNGQRLRTLGYSLLAGVMLFLGFFACCVGLLAAVPVSLMLVLSLFLALRRSSSLPAVQG